MLNQKLNIFISMSSKMLFFAYFLLLCLAWTGHSSVVPSSVNVTYQTRKVDPYDFTNEKVFKQRIISFDGYWCDQCPIFFYPGNEGDIWTFANNTGFMWEIAPQYNAKVVFAEHRYYGHSLPFGNHSFDNLETLQYLSIERALFDFAEVITSMKTNDPKAKDSPVIMFGGSYGGMLAAWFRMKYPHLVEGSIASSAPILQISGLYPCQKYYQIVSKDFRDYSEECFQSIKKSWSVFDKLGSTEDGLKWLTEKFILCEPLSKQTLANFVNWFSDIYGALAMTDYPNPASFLNPLPAYPIKVACSHLFNASVEDHILMTNLYKAISVYTNYTGQSSCNDVKGAFGALGEITTWTFQTCTEVVQPICNKASNDSMFPEYAWNFQRVSDDCYNQFKVRPEENKLRLLFGGKKIQAASNIVFSNGDRDPWSAGGVLSKLGQSLIVLNIPGACHHEDLKARGPNDSSALLKAREAEKLLIATWIHEYYERNEMWPKEWKEIKVKLRQYL